MTFSRMEAALEDAFVEWFNTFECKSSPIDTVVELADGVVFSEVLTDIDAKWFKQLSKPNGHNNVSAENTNGTTAKDANNWVTRLNNLKKLHKLITRYFEEVLGQDPELLPAVNLNTIAKDADLHELLLLCQLIVAIAVQSDNNRTYIDMIQSLSQKSQHALMVSIEEVMNSFNNEDTTNTRMSQLSGNSNTTTSRSFQLDSDMPYRYQLEFERIMMEKRQIETTHTQLSAEFDELRNRFEDLLIEKEHLNTRLHDMDEAINQANTTGKADYVMRTEIDHLKQDLAKSEERRQETELMLEEHQATINELKRKAEELQNKADETEVMRDELEEARHEIERMHKLETLLEKYKRKLEDTADLKRQIKALEEQNTSLLERSHQVEDEYRKVLAFKTLMDSYKDQVQHLEQGNREILKERNKLEEEVRNMAQTCHVLEQDRDRNMEQVQLLEEQIREMELGGGTTLDEAIDRRASVVIDDDIDPDSANAVEENMKKANVTEMRLSIRRLQRQIKEMEEAQQKQQQPSSNGGETTPAGQATEAPQSSKEQLQKEYAAVQEERDRLRQELNQIRNGIPDSLLNQTQTIMAFRSRILDLEKECTFLKEGTIKLEANVLQGTRSVAKDADTLQLYEKEHTKIQGRLNRLEDITKMQLHDINRMLVEANYLHGLGTDGVITDRPRLSDEDLEVIKEQNAALQIQVLHLQEEINETQSKTRKTREMIKLYTQLLQEMTARFMRPDEPSALLTRTPRSKEEENDLLKKQIHDVRVQSRREQQLIISAWYDLARRNHREVSSLSMGSTPSSWLGRQRKLLDGQLRKRLC